MSEMAAHDAHAHPPGFAHQFEDVAQQKEAGTLGMWVFLVTEILFFGGMFTAYIVYRSLHLPGFDHRQPPFAEVKFGATNTAVLICSSLTMAMAIRSAQTGKSKGTIIFWLILTMILGAAFLGAQVHVRVARRLPRAHRAGSFFGFENRPEWGANAPDVQMFMCFYFFMTGLARAAHGRRARHPDRAGDHDRAQQVFVRILRAA